MANKSKKVEVEKKKCHRCKKMLPIGDFIPETDCCFACHELFIMKKTGHGVVKVVPGLGIYAR